MKNWLLGIAFLVPAVLVSGGRLQAQDAQSLAMKHMTCVISNAAKLDDGKMAPQELAKLVEPHCHDEHVAAEAAVGVSAEGAAAIESDHTLAAVLFYRSRAKALGH
jgi:hypothetical protein